ncbi:VMAP-C domain-containing protein [Leptothoe spongobia]|uniref:Trypsin-like peptidase domain-containing protein n=1 Tax=Leptothoe spongobia TAU-MAC 1115 TaxID=1967444 RepID=A0A947GMY7_9CYAN|nr:trypsin-like serine protease [Leptothoe spongobia]MBT9317952.1 trypsin-like peptidase domain-containing protein [Leptothoe spongobia TAU-MAC 1115]
MAKESVTSVQSYKNAIARIHGKSNKVIGAGFLVDGGVITCAHVVRDALGLGRGQTPEKGSTVVVSFPFSASKKQRFSTEVKIFHYRKEEDEDRQDIAGLILRSPLPEKVSPIRTIEAHGLDNTFRVIGFPKNRTAGREDKGQFMTDLSDGLVQIRRQDGYSIQAGFSGSAIWDETVAAVVGMTVAVETEEENSDIAFMVPAAPLVELQRQLACLELEQLLTAAKEDEPLVEQIQLATDRAYPICCPKGWTVPKPVDAKLHALQDVSLAGSDYEAIYRFVALLIQPELDLPQDLRKKLQVWLEPKVETWQKLLNQAKEKLAQEQKDQAKITESVLLIAVMPIEGGETYPLQAWFMPDVAEYKPVSGSGGQPVKAPKAFDEEVTVDTLARVIQDCVAEVEQQSPRELIIHLILPLELIHQSCDRTFLSKDFPFEPDIRVGVKHRFVVRIAERLIPILWRKYGSKWQQKWAEFQKLQGTKGCPTFVCGNEALEDSASLYAKLQHSKSLGLKLTKICADENYPEIFGAVMAAGIPAGIWLRSDTFCEELDAMDKVDQLLACKMARLPEMVKRARADAIASAPKAEDAHIGHHLSLLWDDPHLVHPSAHPANHMSLGR